jgi:hypothetical protein
MKNHEIIEKIIFNRYEYVVGVTYVALDNISAIFA